MRLLWTLLRVAVIVIGIAVTFVTLVFVDGPDGRRILFEGVVIDLVALVVIVAAAWSLWRDRGALA